MAQSTVGLRLDEKTRQRLKALGKTRDRSPHYLMKEAVERYLEAEELIEAERQLTNQRWERYELTGQTVSQDDVKNWLAGLSDNNSAKP